jgi:predicted RNase H-like nuclease
VIDGVLNPPSRSLQKIVGVDGCRTGWVVACCEIKPTQRLTDSTDRKNRGPEPKQQPVALPSAECENGTSDKSPGQQIEVVILPSAKAIADFAGPNSCYAWDIPIGLPPAGPRECDRLVRQALGPGRGSSVFPAPIRPQLAAATHADACEIGQQVDGRKISVQGWNLVPKIREIDTLLQLRPELRLQVHEVHPELSFQTMNGNNPLNGGKKSAEGAADRVRLLGQEFPGLDLEGLLARFPRSACQPDDLLDALACLWTAGRIAKGLSALRPDPAPVDELGIRMAIFT